MIHNLHLIRRHLNGRPLPFALPLALASASLLLIGLGVALLR
jgi:hypothetical protein